MTRKIKYKPVSKELERMAKPSLNSTTRASVGLDQAVGEFFYLNANQLVPFKNQARKAFSHEEIEKLSISIKKYGIRQPLTVKKVGDSKYEVVSGERRLRAAKLIDLQKIPCIILNEDVNANAIALIENIHRKDLHPIELGIVYTNLLKEAVFENQEKLSNAISVSKSKVSEYIKYSELPEDIKHEAIKNQLDSRDKLRSLLKANAQDDLKTMRRIVGIEKKVQKNFSILRILSSEGKIQIQDTGIIKLSKVDRKVLKEHLVKILDKIEI